MKTSSPNHRQASPALRRGVRAFTTIELLVVIGVLVVLIALTTIGLNVVGDKMKATATRTTMAGLKSMLAEAESAGLLKRQPRGVFEDDGDWRPIVDANGQPIDVQGNNPATGPVADFWRRPTVSNDGTPSALTAPGNVTEVFASTWKNSVAIKNTGIALAQLRTNPGIAKTLEGYPAGVAKVPAYWSPNATYGEGARVVFSNGDPSETNRPLLVYVARQPAKGTSQSPTSTTYWTPDYGALHDSWGRPILFVPACGLKGVTSGGTTYTDAMPIKAPDGKPFWASAGPDGDFSKGDDNIYSFEN